MSWDTCGACTPLRSTGRGAPRAFAAGILCVLVLAAACGGPTKSTGPVITIGSSKPTTTTRPGATTTTAPPPRVVSLYFERANLLGVSHRQIPATGDARLQSLDALLGGPDASETAAGLATDIPKGTDLRGLSVSNGVAVVNFSPLFLLSAPASVFLVRASQVLYTLTQFSNVAKVSFKVGGVPLGTVDGVDLGAPLGRSQLTSALPDVLLEDPAVGDSLHGTLQLSGVSTIDGTYSAQLFDASGKLVVGTVNTVTAGATFNVSMPFSGVTTQQGVLKLFATPTAPGSTVQQTDITLAISS